MTNESSTKYSIDEYGGSIERRYSSCSSWYDWSRTFQSSSCQSRHKSQRRVIINVNRDLGAVLWRQEVLLETQLSTLKQPELCLH